MSVNLRNVILGLCLVALVGQGNGFAAEPIHLSDVLKEGAGAAAMFPDKAFNVTRVGVYDTPGTAFGVAVQGAYAYVADDFAGRVMGAEVGRAAWERAQTYYGDTAGDGT